MKIGILTVPFNNNYGGFLQAFALKKVLTDIGHEVIFISRRRNKVDIPLIKYIIGYPYYCFWKYRQAKRQAYLSKYTDEFKKKYLEPITENYYTTKQISRCLKYGFDAVVVGSDQVWRYKYAKASVEDFFLGFLPIESKIKRVSYAASFGTEDQEYPEEVLKRCSLLLSKFDAISVREKSAISLLSKYWGILAENVNWVLDPTLLLSSNDYVKIFDLKRDDKQKYVFTYILDETEDKTRLIESFICARNLGRKDIKAQTGNTLDLAPLASVETWLEGIMNADFVFTDSFHGAVFSILFHRPFIVYGNINRGKSRFESLLSLLGLQERYMDESTAVPDIDANIDWESVECIIREYKMATMCFLTDSLN